MTGFAQLRMTRETSWAEKLAHDLEYVADRSVRLYLRVVRRDRLADHHQPRPRARRAFSRSRLAMCGICGLLSLDGAPVDPGVVEAMNETLVHRGPDSAGTFAEDPVALAMRRLSIIDLEGGDQPVGNEDGRIQVVQNGEIYNYRELRARLERTGHKFRDARRHRGARAPLRGARPGVRRGPARHVRDRAVGPARATAGAGARPLRDQAALLPGRATATLSFASELKALLRQPGFSREIDLDALEAYLAFNSIPAPLTIFREARKLPAGHLLLVEGDEPRLRRYARPRPARAGARAHARARPSSPTSCASACATPCARTSSPTCRSA